jgi:hypothetical protein
MDKDTDFEGILVAAIQNPINKKNIPSYFDRECKRAEYWNAQEFLDELRAALDRLFEKIQTRYKDKKEASIEERFLPLSSILGIPLEVLYLKDLELLKDALAEAYRQVQPLNNTKPAKINSTQIEDHSSMQGDYLKFIAPSHLGEFKYLVDRAGPYKIDISPVRVAAFAEMLYEEKIIINNRNRRVRLNEFSEAYFKINIKEALESRHNVQRENHKNKIVETLPPLKKLFAI